jgi:CheY-like chemotaxis protein/anti-sigma regulatory factor (Ser/Thr protein kinase)
LLEKTGEVSVVYATNGHEALAAVPQCFPDLVLTDLQMPEMDGLALTTEIRSKHPGVPVILMTAFGSEDIAIQALKRGAASYVPKKDLPQELAETVENVLAVARAERGHQRLLERMTRIETQFLLENDTTLVSPLIGHLQEHLARMRLCDETGLIRVGIALHEALTNAIHHGNLEVSSEIKEKDEKAYRDLLEERGQQPPYRDRRVQVMASVSSSKATYVIRDQGKGFDVNKLSDPNDPSNLERLSGRGLMLIRTFMDKVYHNETGNEITMVKHPDW